MLVIVKLWESTWTAGKTGSLHFLHSLTAPFYKPLTSPNSTLSYPSKSEKDVTPLFKQLDICNCKGAVEVQTRMLLLLSQRW